MASKIANYKFDSYQDYNAAMERLYNELPSDCRDSSKIYFYGSWGSEYKIEIYSECSNPALAYSICAANGGKYC